jgi:hypothetical protein
VTQQQFCDALVRARLVDPKDLVDIRKISIVVEPGELVMVHIEKHVDDGVLEVVRELGQAVTDG